LLIRGDLRHVWHTACADQVEGSFATSTVRGTLELAVGPTSGSIVGFGSKYIGFGEVMIDDDATWSLGGTVGASQTLDFAGRFSSLTLANPASMAGTIVGFTSSDTIVLAGITDVTGVTLSAGNTLTVSESGGHGLNLDFDPSHTFEQFRFATSAEGTSLTVPCFAAGTRLATPRGLIAVECLCEGDEVCTLSGGQQRIQWIGYRRIDCTHHPAPQTTWPVRITAGAFGNGLPKRDLWLSPDHAVFLDGVLIPVKYLINDVTIGQVPMDEVTYWHVELAQHSVMLAEDMPAESYLDTGDRINFGNGDAPVRLHPDFSTRRWEAHGCAPLAVTGPVLAAVRRQLDEHARTVRIAA
jgi:Hint domain